MVACSVADDTDSSAPGTAKKFNTTEKVVKKEVEAQMETLSDAHQSGSLDGK